MRSAYRDKDRGEKQALWRRAAAGGLALAIEAIVILVLLISGPRLILGGQQPGLKTFDVANQPDAAPAPTPEQKAERKRAAPKPVPPRPPTPAPDATPATGPIPGLIDISHEDFARADISKIKGTADVEQASTAGDSVAVGAAPNGQPLYGAQWYREPTDSQMAFYMPKGLRSGSALIACRTAPDFRVEDCVILEDSPPGSGLARGVRSAAWQFRVRPPRKGGKSLIGAWVQIRFDLIDRSTR